MNRYQSPQFIQSCSSLRQRWENCFHHHIWYKYYSSLFKKGQHHVGFPKTWHPTILLIKSKTMRYGFGILDDLEKHYPTPHPKKVTTMLDFRKFYIHWFLEVKDDEVWFLNSWRPQKNVLHEGCTWVLLGSHSWSSERFLPHLLDRKASK